MMIPRKLRKLYITQTIVTVKQLIHLSILNIVSFNELLTNESSCLHTLCHSTGLVSLYKRPFTNCLGVPHLWLNPN